MNGGTESAQGAKKLLDIQNLHTSFFTHFGEVKAVDDVSLYLDRGETLGIVGESGSGKSVTMLSVMGLLSENGRVVSGSVTLSGRELSNLPEREMESVRGNEIGMIFQDPMTSLDPVFTIGHQITETIMKHKSVSREEAKARAIEILSSVMIPSPSRRMGQYPHEFSGGMRQRVMIAIALCCDPDILIADEPTTALDVTIQAQILDLMKDLNKRTGTSIILITHDLGVVAGICDRVNVMYAGHIAESGTVRDIFHMPRHPYTWGLLKSVPNPKRIVKERLVPIKGQPPDLLKPPAGCAFAPRCEYAMKICLAKRPPAFDIAEGHAASCYLNHPDAPRVPDAPVRAGV
ncbi:MAG: ABC transporter ATP-binding protein [Synergistaceae bacterium]|jgi:oligopeptide transport system ATP-binding protein|nr:ABC transporter ATP-binding protein [Synergistaceae bacterium]